tara:strand:+ start:16000 stop:17586 length:1587 start_codon:yes stop_codon:yes gene_type:complete
MLRKYFKTTLYVVATAFFLGSALSCEEDFRDISTGMIRNGEFITKDTIFNIEVSGKNIENVQSDGFAIGGVLGQYLLGVYNNEKFEKIEASIITQLRIPQDLTIVDQEFESDTTVVTSIDTVLLRIPYNATLLTSTSFTNYTLDSIIGNQTTDFTLNIFRLQTYLNNLNPSSPSSQNNYFSDYNYEVFPEKLNFFEDTQFKPIRTDTAHFVTRSLSTGDVYDTDTIVYPNLNPSISIPLKKNRIKELFLDQYQTASFASQDAFNDYFRGLKIQAEGDDGSLMSLSFNSPSLQPSIDIYYTNTVLTSGGTVVLDTIKKTNTFLLSGIINSEYVMSPGQTPGPNNVVIQGTAGSVGQLKILGDDTDMSGIPDALEDLRTENWLVNDASITLYVDQDIVLSDTIAPYQLFIYKDRLNNTGLESPSQILDYTTEGVNQVGGLLQLDDSNKPNSYTFKITDYISELLSGNINDLPLLGVKAFNPTDPPSLASDTLVRSHNWNPKGVILLNHNTPNESRRAQLKISYSIRAEDN